MAVPWKSWIQEDAGIRDAAFPDIGLLHGDPFFLEGLEPVSPLAGKETADLDGGIHRKEEAEVVEVPQGGMAGIGALNEDDGRGTDLDGIAERHGFADKGTVGYPLPRGQGEQHLLQEPLPIQISAGLRQPFGSSLLGAEEEIVHVDDGAPQDGGQLPGQRGLTRGATSVDGHQQGVLPFRLPADESQGVLGGGPGLSSPAALLLKRCRPV